MCALEKEIYVVDGGFASQLSKHVNEPVDGNPLWSARFLASNPDAVVQTHLDFLRAGADIIITSTYQASIDGFATHLGLSKEESYQLIKTAVHLAKKACKLYKEETAANEKNPREVLIAGSCGPYGAALHDCSEYDGSYVNKVCKSELIEWHRPRIQALTEAGVDLLAFETIPAQTEGEALVELLKEFSDSKAWLSFSCKDEHHLCHGEEFKNAANKCWELNSSQLVAIGVNCVNPKFVSSLLGSAKAGRADHHIPYIVYPNSGEVFSIERGWYGRETCKPVADYVEEWLALGAKYIGGCCRNYAADIAKISEKVNKIIMDKNESTANNDIVKENH